MEAIVDNVMLHSENLEPLLQHLECFLKVFVHYSLTIKLKKNRFLPNSEDFVGFDVECNGNKPTRSSMDQF